MARVLVERMCFESRHLGRWCWNHYVDPELVEKLRRALEAWNKLRGESRG